MLRLVISNKTQFPGSFIEGKEIARPDRRGYAGMQLTQEESEGMSTAGIAINDRPDYRIFSVADLMNMVAQVMDERGRVSKSLTAEPQQ